MCLAKKLGISITSVRMRKKQNGGHVRHKASLGSLAAKRVCGQRSFGRLHRDDGFTTTTANGSVTNTYFMNIKVDALKHNTSSEWDRKVRFYLQHIQGGNNSAKNGSNLASHHPTCSQLPILLTHSPIHVPCVFFTPTYLIANFDPSRPRSKWQRGKSCDLQLGPRFPPVAQPIRVPGCGLLLSLRLGQGTWGCSSTLAVQRPTCNVRIATASTSSFS